MEKFWTQMDKFISAHKLFVAFCGVLIIVWISLQVVVHLRIIEIAKLDAVRIFSWTWPNKEGVLFCSAGHPCAQVLNKSGTEVLVKVTAKQTIEERFLDPATSDQAGVGETLALPEESTISKPGDTPDRRGALHASVGSEIIGADGTSAPPARESRSAQSDRRGALRAPAGSEKFGADGTSGSPGRESRSATSDRRGASHAPAGTEISSHRGAPKDLQKRSLDCEASLTYYRSNDRWILGKVELK
jgi:hypothetical protein